MFNIFALKDFIETKHFVDEVEKSHVKQYTKVVNGKRVIVKDHTDKRTKKKIKVK